MEYKILINIMIKENLVYIYYQSIKLEAKDNQAITRII